MMLIAMRRHMLRLPLKMAIPGPPNEQVQRPAQPVRCNALLGRAPPRWIPGAPRAEVLGYPTDPQRRNDHCHLTQKHIDVSSAPRRGCEIGLRRGARAGYVLASS